VRLLLDEILGLRLARELHARGFDVEAVVERTDLRALPDDAVLEAAHDESRVLVTRNVADFARLHPQWLAEGREHPGMIMVTSQAFPQDRAFVGAVVAALEVVAHRSEGPSQGEILYLRRAG
jgi:predicted nuclease of predicted toxin-antitoxin system